MVHIWIEFDWSAAPISVGRTSRAGGALIHRWLIHGRSGSRVGLRLPPLDRDTGLEVPSYFVRNVM